MHSVLKEYNILPGWDIRPSPRGTVGRTCGIGSNPEKRTSDIPTTTAVISPDLAPTPLEIDLLLINKIKVYQQKDKGTSFQSVLHDVHHS
jgi:hypothetical protein